MGLYVYVNLDPGPIDAERWEACWLTSLQLLEQFPGPLTAMTLDHEHQSRGVYTSHLVFQTGTDQEHWKVGGDLGSRRMGESYFLYRHLTHYQPNPSVAQGTDILWVSNDEQRDVAGLRLFDAKSQGYPYHYAMLAVGILIENSFPEQAVTYGNIDQRQADQILPWMKSILGRSFKPPIVTDAKRLWRRLAKLYADQPSEAIRRFQNLYAATGLGMSPWRTLLSLDDGPPPDVLRDVFQAGLARYNNLRQFGALEMIAALAEADDGIDRILSWASGQEPANSPCHFSAEEILNCLCNLLIPIPLDQRAMLDGLTPSPDQLPTISTMFTHVFTSMAGKPVPCSLYVSEDAVAALFAARWPEQAEKLSELLANRITQALGQLNSQRDQIEQYLAHINQPTTAENTKEMRSTSLEYDPAAESIHAEIERQRKPQVSPEQAATFGKSLRMALNANHELRQILTTFKPEELLSKISLGSREQRFALSESAWEKLETASREELQHLCLLSMMPIVEQTMWEMRLSMFESPHLWPIMAGKTAPGST